MTDVIGLCRQPETGLAAESVEGQRIIDLDMTSETGWIIRKGITQGA